MNQYINFKKQQGFSVLAVILVIVAVIVAIGVWGLSGSSNNSGKNNAVLAATIINQGALYKSTLDKYRIINEQGSLIDGDIILSPNVSDPLNLFDPVNGMEPMTVPRAALELNATFPLGVWGMNPTGFSANEDNSSLYMYTTFLVGGLTKPVCEQINLSLHGTTNIASVSTTYFNVLPDIDSHNYRSVLNLYLHNIPAVHGWKNGCLLHKYNSTDKEFFYFQTAL